MAVKAAVVGFTEKYAAKTTADATSEAPLAESTEIDDVDLDELERIDLVGLLMSDTSDEEVDTDEEDTLRESSLSTEPKERLLINIYVTAILVYRLDQYVPDAFYEMYEVIRDGLITYLIKFGIIGSNAASVSNKLDSAREFFISRIFF
jgi:protein kinase C substrate 80K-H